MQALYHVVKWMAPGRRSGVAPPSSAVAAPVVFARYVQTHVDGDWAADQDQLHRHVYPALLRREVAGGVGVGIGFSGVPAHALEKSSRQHLSTIVQPVTPIHR